MHQTESQQLLKITEKFLILYKTIELEKGITTLQGPFESVTVNADTRTLLQHLIHSHMYLDSRCIYSL